MTTPKYKEFTIEFAEAPYDNRTLLIAKHRGELLYEEIDGGEPEDNTFYRDWRWVASALLQAYHLGREDSKKENK